jgi:hypothetical protein
LWTTIPTLLTILATTADVYEEVLMDHFSIALLARGFGQYIRHSLCLLFLSCLVVFSPLQTSSVGLFEASFWE